MEQKTKKIDVKIIIIAIVVIIAIVEGIIIVTSNKDNSKELQEGLQAKDCIGTWQSITNKDFTITLYEGGTGKQITLRNKENNSYTAITWEIKDNALNITVPYGWGSYSTTGYKVENGKMTSTISDNTVFLKVE